MKNAIILSTDEMGVEDFESSILEAPDLLDKLDALKLDLNVEFAHLGNEFLPDKLTFDFLIIEDECGPVLDILTSIVDIPGLNNVLVCTSNESLRFVESVDRRCLKMITLDFMLGVADLGTTKSNYEFIRSICPNIPIVCISQNADTKDYNQIVEDIRKNKTSVLDKSVLHGGLSTIIRDKLALIDCQNTIDDLTDQLSSAQTSFSDLQSLIKKYGNGSIEELYDESSFRNVLVGNSERMKEVMFDISRYAKNDDHVFLMGETGSGKTTIAEIIHNRSNRKHKTFERIDCGSLASNLIESELFGHEKWAFTDAKELKIGKLESANGGTVFLDEIGKLSLEAQSKLLTAIDEKTIVRLGSRKKIHLNIRIICATNQEDDFLRDSNSFRRDLLSRINKQRITVPSLSDRINDLEPLVYEIASSFFRKTDGESKNRLIFDTASIDLLKKQNWEDNIRGLKKVVEELIKLLTFIKAFDSNGKADVVPLAVKIALNKTLGEVGGSMTHKGSFKKKEISPKNIEYVDALNDSIGKLKEGGLPFTQPNIAKVLGKTHAGISQYFSRNFLVIAEVLNKEPERYSDLIECLEENKQKDWVMKVYQNLKL